MPPGVQVTCGQLNQADEAKVAVLGMVFHIHPQSSRRTDPAHHLVQLGWSGDPFSRGSVKISRQRWRPATQVHLHR